MVNATFTPASRRSPITSSAPGTAVTPSANTSRSDQIEDDELQVDVVIRILVVLTTDLVDVGHVELVILVELVVCRLVGGVDDVVDRSCVVELRRQDPVLGHWGAFLCGQRAKNGVFRPGPLPLGALHGERCASVENAKQAGRILRQPRVTGR